MRYYPALDGLRAVAVGLVLVAHSGVWWRVRSGGAGVDAFFALSGFLITAIILAELDSTGGVCIRRFYIRRFLRLMPCLWLTVVATFLVWIGVFATDLSLDAVYSLTYVMNWARAAGEPTGVLSHTWSLAIEEQFYLLWPLVVRWLCNNPSRRVAQGTMFLVAALIVVTYRQFLIGLCSIDRIHYGIDTHADPLLIGSSLACYWSASRNRSTQRWQRIAISYYIAPICFAIIAWIATHWAWWQDDTLALRVGYSVVAICTAGLIVDATLTCPGPVVRVLALKPFAWVGRISYGIYLWHFPIYHGLVLCGVTSRLSLFALGTALTLLVSATSFYLVEARLLRLKKRFDSTIKPTQSKHSTLLC